MRDLAHKSKRFAGLSFSWWIWLKRNVYPKWVIHKISISNAMSELGEQTAGFTKIKWNLASPDYLVMEFSWNLSPLLHVERKCVWHDCVYCIKFCSGSDRSSQVTQYEKTNKSGTYTPLWLIGRYSMLIPTHTKNSAKILFSQYYWMQVARDYSYSYDDNLAKGLIQKCRSFTQTIKANT